MRRIRTAFLVMALTAGPVSAEPAVTVNMHPYVVEGDTVSELRQSLNERSPVEYKGQRYDAYTSWTVDWDIRWQKEDGPCRVRHTEVRLTVDMTLPRLAAGHGLSSGALSQWQRYIKALREHENGHKGFGLKAAREIERRLPELTPRLQCQSLLSDARSMADSVLERYMQQERRYDRRTDYGRTQGAVFPVKNNR